MSDSANNSENPIVACMVSLGCAKNLVDAEVMCGTMAVHSICLTDDPEEADVFIINTCGFIQSARDEAEENIRKALKWKRSGRRRGYDRRVIVGGCLAQRFAPEYAEKYPQVDCFIGIDDVPNIHAVITRLFEQPPQPDEDARPEIAVGNGVPEYLYDDQSPRIQTTPSSYAYVKIAEGCNHHCAFCAIPGIRGKLRSRPVASIVNECRQLLSAGVRELDIIAQDTTAYGIDLPDRPTLTALLKQIDSLPGDFWIRVLYTHPVHITDQFIDFLAGGRHAVPYLDVPLQHIADPILRGMRRAISTEKTLSLMNGIRSRHPQMVVRTTFLTGFPGEDDQMHRQLLDFVRDYGFDRLGVFAFSPEKGTAAYEIREGLVPQKLAEARRDEILALQKKIAYERNQSQIGKTVRVLLEERRGRRLYAGRGIGDAPDVDQTILVRVPANANLPPLDSFVDAVVKTAGEYELGAVLKTAAHQP